MNKKRSVASLSSTQTGTSSVSSFSKINYERKNLNNKFKESSLTIKVKKTFTPKITQIENEQK